MSYTAHLANLNREKRSQTDNTDSHESTDDLCAICPIAQSEIDARDPASTISIISSTTNLGPDDRVVIAAMGFIVPPEQEIICHHVDSYDLTAAQEWFVTRHGTHPSTRRVLSDDERNRIKFRAEMQSFIKLEVTLEEIQEMFRLYTETLAANTVDPNSDTYIMLRAHLCPEMLPNYCKFTREQSEDYLAKAKANGSKFTWIARPSKFKGYEFAKDSSSRFYPMVEYTAISSFDTETGKFRHDLIEKIYSRGFYRGGGAWNGGTFNLSRTYGTPCFFDILHNILKTIHKDLCDIRAYIPPILVQDSVQSQDQPEDHHPSLIPQIDASVSKDDSVPPVITQSIPVISAGPDPIPLIPPFNPDDK